MMNIIEITPCRAEKYIIASGNRSSGNKLFQIIFGKDGSLFVNFPYYEKSHGIASVMKFPCTRGPIDLSLESYGKVTSHRIKYSHHLDGEAHFSQDTKIKTKIRKKSVPLHDINGHIFTIQLQGLKYFDKYKKGILEKQ